MEAQDRIIAGGGLTSLFAGGSGETDANIVESGAYVMSTDKATNLPPESAYYLVVVFRYHTSDLACAQIAINLSNGNLYSRDYVSATWKPWVGCSSRKIEATSIPNGADLNSDTYKNRGFYVSNLGANVISNLPSYFGGKGAFELTVTGLDGNSYCTQWLKSHNLNRMWVRTQQNWQTPWTWTDWQEVPLHSEFVRNNTDGIELGKTLTSSSDHGGYIDFHYNGSTADYTSRIMEISSGTIRTIGNLDVTGWGQFSNGVWIPSGGFYLQSNNSAYGSSLPSAGTKGRVFFKKV